MILSVFSSSCCLCCFRFNLVYWDQCPYHLWEFVFRLMLISSNLKYSSLYNVLAQWYCRAMHQKTMPKYHHKVLVNQCDCRAHVVVKLWNNFLLLGLWDESMLHCKSNKYSQELVSAIPINFRNVLNCTCYSNQI